MSPCPCRSPGVAGLPGDAAGGGRGARGHRRLLDDHPAAAVALHRAPPQRTAPRLAPAKGTGGPWLIYMTVLMPMGGVGGGPSYRLADAQLGHPWGIYTSRLTRVDSLSVCVGVFVFE